MKQNVCFRSSLGQLCRARCLLGCIKAYIFLNFMPKQTYVLFRCHFFLVPWSYLPPGLYTQQKMWFGVTRALYYSVLRSILFPVSKLKLCRNNPSTIHSVLSHISTCTKKTWLIVFCQQTQLSITFFFLYMYSCTCTNSGCIPCICNWSRMLQMYILKL